MIEDLYVCEEALYEMRVRRISQVFDMFPYFFVSSPPRFLSPSSSKVRHDDHDGAGEEEDKGVEDALSPPEKEEEEVLAGRETDSMSTPMMNATAPPFSSSFASSPSFLFSPPSCCSLRPLVMRSTGDGQGREWGRGESHTRAGVSVYHRGHHEGRDSTSLLPEGEREGGVEEGGSREGGERRDRDDHLSKGRDKRKECPADMEDPRGAGIRKTLGPTGFVQKMEAEEKKKDDEGREEERRDLIAGYVDDRCEEDDEGEEEEEEDGEKKEENDDEEPRKEREKEEEEDAAMLPWILMPNLTPPLQNTCHHATDNSSAIISGKGEVAGE